MKKTYLVIALIFSFIAVGMSASMGIGDMTQFVDPNRPFENASLTATIFTFLASVVALIGFILGIIATVKSKKHFAVSILSFISGITMLSCALTPILHSNYPIFIALTVASGIIEIIAGAVFLLYLLSNQNTQQNEKNSSKHLKSQLKQLQNLYEANILDKDEFEAKKENLLNSSNDNTPQISNAHPKKPLFASIILSVIVVVYCVTALPIISASYKSKVYDYVVETISDYDSEFLDDYLDYLPSNYKDTRNIKTTYNKVRYYLYSLGDLEGYVGLTKIQQSDYRWDFTKILNNIYRFDIDNIRWESGSLYMQITYNQGRKTFSTNLPNNKVSSKSYYFYETYRSNSIIIGYENQNNSSDKFDAYRISNLKYNSTTQIFSISVYTYSNSRTYTMQYQYI